MRRKVYSSLALYIHLLFKRALEAQHASINELDVSKMDQVFAFLQFLASLLFTPHGL